MAADERSFCPRCGSPLIDGECIQFCSPVAPGEPKDPDLAELLDQVERHVRRFIGFGSRHQSVAVTLFIAHAYAVEGAPMAAYLRIRSAAEESGKTTLLEVMAQLLRRHAINAVSVSPSVVFRLRDKVGPVALLLDETDNALAKRQDDGTRDLIALLNAGYRRSAMAYRNEGRSFEPRGFKAFGPAAVAGIGYLDPTTESRCIPVVLHRKPRGSLERFVSFLVEPEANAIADRLEAWVTDDVVDRLRGHVPDYPAELRDRHVEVWWSLFSIADLAGGTWPHDARSAARALHVETEDDSTLSLGVLLLAHIRAAFEESGTDRLATKDLLGLLVANEEGPWGKWWGTELNRDGAPRAAAADLARKLRGFETPDGQRIRPRVIRLPDGSTPRGYQRVDFDAAWATYLGFGFPPATDATDATALASTVAGVAPVASPQPNGAGDGRPAQSIEEAVAMVQASVPGSEVVT